MKLEHQNNNNTRIANVVAQVYIWLSDFELVGYETLDKDPSGSKLLKRSFLVSNSEIKAGKEQSDHEVGYERKKQLVLLKSLTPPHRAFEAAPSTFSCG